MASLVFGALNQKEKKEETERSFRRGGSGEQDHEEWDETSSDDDSDNSSIFDPPIQNYRFTYTANRINTSAEIPHAQSFQIARVMKNGRTRSGIGGSGSKISF